jgi:hypothetical protein
LNGAPGRLASRLSPALLFAGLVLVLYANPLFQRRNFVGRDILQYNLPLEKAVHDSWARGQIPVWWPTTSGGRPLLPNPNAGVFYPVRLALSRVSFPLAMRIYPVFHWILAGWGMLLLLPAMGASRTGAWVSAVSFAFSGVLVSEVFFTNFLPGAALLPWSLWALVRPATRPIWRILPIAAAYGLMALAGDAFSLALALLSGCLWLILETPRRDRFPQLLQWLLGLAVALLLALPQVLATALFAPETRRAVSGFRLGDVTLYTIPWARLLEVVVPYPLGESWTTDFSLDWGSLAFKRFYVAFFVGPMALVGLFMASVGGAARGRRFARWLVCVTVAVALCGHFLPSSWASLPSPIPLRFPEKFMLGATLGLAVAAGLAVDGLRGRRPARDGLLAVAAILAVAAVAAWLNPRAAARMAVATVAAPPGSSAIAAGELPCALAEGGLLWAVTAVAAALLSRPGRVPVAAALVLLTAVPVAANRATARSAHEAEAFAPTPFARRLMQKDPEGTYRTLDESLYRESSLLAASQSGDVLGSELIRQTWFLATPSLWNCGTVFNFDTDAGDLSRVESLRRVAMQAAGQPDSAAFFQSLSLRFGIRFRDEEPVAGFQPFGGDAFRAWDENPGALPDIRLVQRWQEAAGPVEALSVLPRLQAGEIVIETDRRASGSARPGQVQILENTPERLELATECPDPAWLFVLRGDWSYRTVLVDGRPTPVSPAQIGFSAVSLPAGAHRILWRENAPGLEASRWGPLAGALVLLGVGLAGKRR